MVDENIPPKTKNEKKKRYERESCINNVKLKINIPQNKEYNHPLNDGTYIKKSKNKHKRGSLENVSSNPWGDVRIDEQSSLRRSRSLAISKGNIFSSSSQLNPEHIKQRRRSQLIPRAKLVDRSSLRDVSRFSEFDGASRALAKRKSIASPSEYQHHTSNEIGNSKKRNFDDTYSYVSLNHNYPQNQAEQKAPYNKKDNYCQHSYEDLSSLKLPNYYPDSKCDTEITDNISITENISDESIDQNNNKTFIIKPKYSSCGNIPGIDWDLNGPESISYDDNIVLTTNKEYYKNNKNTDIKPKTIRGPSHFNDFFYSKSKSSDSFYSSPNLSPNSLESVDAQTDTNFDEIKLNNDNITKVVEASEKVKARCKEELFIETNPIYETAKASQNNKNDIRTLIEVKDSNIISSNEGEEFKTVIKVDSSNISEDDNKSKKSTSSESSKQEAKQHSHNYLKEFLESQKGSKRPLQNFIAKKLSNLSRKNSKESTGSNLEENQYHSLPDVNIGKNLKKSEKIDKKLRKASRKNSESKENRFIVNIGKHFDLTASSSGPVDFELKIAKVPKKSKPAKATKLDKNDQQLIEAVRNLKQTLSASCSNLEATSYHAKPEVIALKPKKSESFTCLSQTENMALAKKDECTREFQEKLGSMRTYWNKLTGSHEKVPPEPEKCKVVDFQTKIEEVKKKFENNSPEIVEKPINKVQLVKQMFETKPQEKQDKISPIIKETCSYFEKNPRNSHSQDFQSLNPNSIEIINKDKTKTEPKTFKPVSKSNSITYPEFDHVRYRVVKSDLFQKKIFANCEKESQFDGLMQYLQDYSFQELLIDNNIVIIEPIRTKIQYEPNNKNKSPKNVTPLLHSKKEDEEKTNLRRPFFYHPIRVNKEVNDDELPNPDTVRQVRQFFEGGLKRSLSSENVKPTFKEKYLSQPDPDKDRCSAADSNSNPSDFGSQENLYDSIDADANAEGDHCCNKQVSEDVLEKIRERGSTVTYYGGRMVKSQCTQPVLTKFIMEEIQNNEKRAKECSCKRNFNGNKANDCTNKGNVNSKDIYHGVKFRLLKSNSCSSRMELVGTQNIQDSKRKYLSKCRQSNPNIKKDKENCIVEVTEMENKAVSNKVTNKNQINENIRQQMRKDSQPKIIGEEMKVPNNKLTQWSQVNNERKNYSSITFTDKMPKKALDYHNYDKVSTKSKKFDEMDFEPYEVA